VPLAPVVLQKLGDVLGAERGAPDRRAQRPGAASGHRCAGSGRRPGAALRSGPAARVRKCRVQSAFPGRAVVAEQVPQVAGQCPGCVQGKQPVGGGQQRCDATESSGGARSSWPSRSRPRASDVVTVRIERHGVTPPGPAPDALESSRRFRTDRFGPSRGDANGISGASALQGRARCRRATGHASSDKDHPASDAYVHDRSVLHPPEAPVAGRRTHQNACSASPQPRQRHVSARSGCRQSACP
jgi:hypothetical protein